jgi:hypothetical protein
VYAELKRRDEQMVTEYREEVDTLLVFVRPPGPSSFMYRANVSTLI